MNIAGVIKDWMLIFFSFYVFKAPVTRLNLAGYAFCCTGVAVYNWQKLQQLKKRQQQAKDKSGDDDVIRKGNDEEKAPLMNGNKEDEVVKLNGDATKTG